MTDLHRGTVETVLRDICEALRARVTYRKDAKHDLGDFLGAAKSKLAELLKVGVAVAKSRKHDTSEPDRRLAHCFAVRDGLGNEEWSLNPIVHYNSWAQMTPQDFAPVVGAYKKFLGSFACAYCRGLFRVEGHAGGETVRCPCGKGAWKLNRAG